MKNLAAVLISATILVAGCKKAKDGKDGATGPQGPAGIVTTSTNGFIKGTITGTNRDGNGFAKTFNYTNYWGSPGATIDSTGFSFDFGLFRGTDILSNDGASLYFSVPTLATSTSTFYFSGFSFSEAMSGNRLFQFQVNNSTPATITGLSYNQSTGLVKGNYNVSVPPSNNNTGNAANVSGSFEVTATKLYYRSATPASPPVKNTGRDQN